MNRHGVTLFELLVVLTVLGILTSLGTLTHARRAATPGAPWAGTLLHAHLKAMHAPAGSRSWVRVGTDSIHVLILPDGRVLAELLDPFDGALPDATR